MKTLGELEAALVAEVSRRKGLGGYNSDAESLLLAFEALLLLTRKLEDSMANRP